MKFEVLKKQKPNVKDSPQDYLDAHVDRSAVMRKLEAGRGIQFADDKENDDANAFIQSTVESSFGMGDAGSGHTDEAIKSNAWLVSQWSGAIVDKNDDLATVLKRLMLERQAEIRLSSSVKPEELKMQLVVPPKELNPAYNSMPRREPSHLQGNQGP